MTIRPWRNIKGPIPEILPSSGTRASVKDADQLWETTLNPENRVLKRVEIEDARMASEVTELLMGSDVPPRKKFIYDHADEAEIDA